MKKSLPILCITLFFLSCNSGDTSNNNKTDTTGTKSENPVGIENVNGNIPDTVNTIDIGTHKPNEINGSDSLKTDTLKK